MEPIKIVIAEDNEIYLAGLERVLQMSEGFEVSGVTRNGRELLNWVKHHEAHVAVTDIQMPLLNGIEAARVLSREHPLVKVLALTMHSSEFLIVDMLEAGAVGYVDKNTSEEKLIEAIRTVHQGFHYHCSTTSMRLAKLVAASKAKLNREDVEFSEEELKVIQLLCEEYATKQIAPLLSFSESTIDKIRRHFGGEHVTVSTAWQELDTINFSNGKIVFESDPLGRSDFGGLYNIQKPLKFIKVYNYDAVTGSYNLIKVIQLFHSYFINGSDNSTKRLRLDSMQVQTSSGSPVQTYRFTYNTSIALPGKLAKQADYWGYFNNRINYRPGDQNQTPSSIPQTTITYYQPPYAPAQVTIGGTNAAARDPDPSYMQAAILQQITFPTGGYTQFEYETNQYLDDNGNTKYAGGLRIKSIKSYTSSSAAPLVKTYKYGSDESGYGRANFMLDQYFFTNRQNCRYVDVSEDQFGICGEAYDTKTMTTYFANPINDIEGTDGSPVVYPVVTEYEGDNSTNVGKTVYQFTDKADVKTSVIGYGKPYFDSYQFIRGMLSNKTLYKNDGAGNYTKVYEEKKGYQYFPYQFSTGGIGAVVRKRVIDDGSSGAMNNLGVNFGTECAHFSDSYNYDYTNYDIVTGDNKLVADTIINYQQNDATKYVQTITNYSYDDVTHLGLTQVQTINSKGEVLKSTYTYPYNYSTSPYSSMDAAHLWDKQIAETKFNGSTQLLQQTNNYSSFTGNNYELSNTLIQIKSNNAETRAFFNNYDLKGNILEMQKANDVRQSYIWGYNKMYPIAEAMNAKANEIFFDSFEEGTGWSGTTAPQYGDAPISAYDNTMSHAGGYSARIDKPTLGEKYCHSDQTLSVTLTAPTKYKVSGWVYSNGPSVDIYLFMKRAGETSYYTYIDYLTTSTINQWVYVDKDFTVPADVTQLNVRLDNNGGGTVWFDDVRLYPSAAQMSTYTYKPLVGMTSATDINNKTTYYTYDSFGRLFVIRDQDGNILKKYCYNYAGQQEQCNFYESAPIGDYYYSQNCAPGETPQPYYVTVPKGMFTSSASQPDADAQAEQYAQSEANQYGGCQQANITLSFYNNDGTGFSLDLYNVDTGEEFWFDVDPFNSGILGDIPAGNYDISISPYDYYGYYSYSVGCGYYNSGSSTVSFYGVQLDTNCNSFEMY